MNTKKKFVPILLISFGLILVVSGVYFYRINSIHNQTKIILEDNIQTPTTLKVGDLLGKFTITEIKKCDFPDTDKDLICGINTLGTAEFEGSFFLSGYFGEYCFEIDMTKEINQKALTIPDKDPTKNKHGFCFRDDISKKIPEKYLLTEYDVPSELIKIIVKDYKFDWRPMGVTDDVELIGVVK